MALWKALGLEERGLQRVAGVDPRKEQRLVSAGILSVQRLRAVLDDDCNGDINRMRAFLQVIGVLPKSV